MRFALINDRSRRLWFLSLLWIVACVAYGQELEPRALSMIPTGGNFAVASYAYSHGNFLEDENIPVEDLKANVHSIITGYARSFKLFNRLAKFDVIAPYSIGKYKAIVSSVDTSAIRHGFGDPMARISLILVGGPALSPAEYTKQDLSRFRLGVNFRARVPLGKYDNTKIINIGANRWAFKAGIAASYRVNKFIFEGFVYSWFFTENKQFNGDDNLSQGTVLTFQVHATYLLKKGKWLAVSLGQSGFGETTINDVHQENSQNTWKFGIAFALPLKDNQALKFAFTNGITTKFGANFTTLVIAYQFMWFDKPK